MARYRRKSSDVEAEQFGIPPLCRIGRELPEGVIGVPSPGADNWNYEGCVFFLETLGGRVPIQRGDYIVTNEYGRRYPMSRTVFEATFEPLMDEE